MLLIIIFKISIRNMADKKIVLGYWPISGLGQANRYLLSIVGANWEDKLYTDSKQWFEQDKHTLGLKFPNLPYLIDGDIKITESLAILKYLARKYREELLGKNLEDYSLIETWLGVISDIQAAYFPLFSNLNWKKDLEGVWNKINDKLILMEKNVVDNTALGYLTIVDLKLTPLLLSLFKVYPLHESEFKNLAGLRDYIHSLP
jgi:glutathione S-transferase